MIKKIVGKLEPMNNSIKGIAGSNEGVSKRIIKWKIADDNGIYLEFTLPYFKYLPNSTSCLLSHSTGYF
jgi:hypothetical protein